MWNSHANKGMATGGSLFGAGVWRPHSAVDHLLSFPASLTVLYLFCSSATFLRLSLTPMSSPVPSCASSAGDHSTSSAPAPRAEPLGDDTLLTPATSNISPIDTTAPSWKPNYDLRHPPDVIRPYDAEEALEDLPGVSYALEVFLSSHMLESEEYCHKMDETKYVHR